ncbi:DUF5305 domain-containing protein [Halovivax limisalsi]|uniref:DUF5305 domain-containing protein n=1 Tax=Halovivax limisalsi TaxID=1453760 RepID=UPI001FFDC7C7|nr:DUF5305 domain-containing protein [Halovivax limisalsi]
MTTRERDRQDVQGVSATRRLEIRLREVLDRRFLAVVVLLGLVVLGGGWVAYNTHVDPGTEETTAVVGSWSEEPELSHQARVQADNPVFETGTVRADRPLYFTRLMPELEGLYAYAYDGSVTDGSLSVEATSYLVIRAVDGEETLWQERERLETTSVDGVEPGAAVPLSFTVNVSELDARIGSIVADLGADPGTTETSVVVKTTASGTIDGKQVANAHEATYSIERNDGSYAVTTETSGLGGGEFTRTVTTERTYGPLRSFGSLAALLFGVGALAWVVHGRRTGTLGPSREELAALELAQERAEYDEWVSRGRIPVGELEGPTIEVESLEDIVDVAIDSDRRVIEDPTAEAYYVADRGAVYVYEPAEFPGADEALPAPADDAEPIEIDPETTLDEPVEAEPEAILDDVESDRARRDSAPAAGSRVAVDGPGADQASLEALFADVETWEDELVTPDANGASSGGDSDSSNAASPPMEPDGGTEPDATDHG